MGTTTTTDGALIDTVTYTSPLVGYCTQTDVEFVWSQFGVTARLDDNLDGQSDGGLMNRAIEKASSDINAMLAMRYAVSVIRQAAWIKWACAYFTAVTIGKRRGNAVPEQIMAEAQAYLTDIQAIAAYQKNLILNDGTPAPPLHDTSPAVTNHIVDSRYFDAKIRRVPTTSSQATQAPSRKQFDATDPFTLP